MRLPARIKDFIDPYPNRMRPRHVRNGVIVLALIALVTYSTITANIPVINGPPGKPVRAEFATANQVDTRTPVRIRGVDVGKVQKVEGGADPRRSSMVTLRVTKGGVTIHRDARAVIRWRTLMGGRVYVDLDPGSPSAPPLGNGTIGLQRTSSQVEMDDAFRPYAGGTAEAQRGVFKGLTQGFSDPRGIDRTIDTLPALRTVERGMEPYRGRQGDDLRRLVASTAKSSAALGRDTSQLQGLVEGANRTLAAFDDRRQDLGDMLELAPSTLDQTTVTMARLRTTLAHLDPMVADLRPGARRLAGASNAAVPAFHQTRALLAQAQPLLRNARPTLAGLETASNAGAPLLQGLEPVIDRMDNDVLPFLHTRDGETRLRTYEAIGPFFSTVGGGSSEFDDEGYRLRLTVPFGSNSAYSTGQKDMQRSCDHSVSAAREKYCGPLATFLARTWFGKGTGK